MAVSEENEIPSRGLFLHHAAISLFGGWRATSRDKRSSAGRSSQYANEERIRHGLVRSAGKRCAGLLLCQLALVSATWSGTAWADGANQLFVEIEDPGQLGRILDHNEADVARRAYLAKRYRVVEVNTAVLESDEPFYLNLFDDVSIRVETLELSTGASEFNRRWRARVLDFGPSGQDVEMLRRGLAEAEKDRAPHIPAGALEQNFMELSAILVSYDVDADSGVANPSGQRRFGRVSPEEPSEPVTGPDSPWRLIHGAFEAFGLSRVSVFGRGGEIVNYAVSPLQWSPRYAMVVEADPSRIASYIADPVERKALAEEYLEFERSLPSEEGKVTMGEIE